MATFGQWAEFGPYFSGGNLCMLKLYHYAAGTTTLKDSYIDREKTTIAAQPMVSDANGIVSGYFDGIYKFRLDLSTDGVTYTTVYTQDKVAIVDQSSSLSGEGASLNTASTLTLGTDGDFFHVTGSTAITALSGTQNRVTLVADSAFTLTYSGNLILFNAANYTTTAGDIFGFINEGANVWREEFRTLSTAALMRTALDLDNRIFSTGDVKISFKTTADPTWVLMDDGTIGDGTSAATTRANADTSPLYTLLWNNIVDVWAPVIGGRGISASVDFAAHKPMALPKQLGLALAGYGAGIRTVSGTSTEVDLTGNTLTVPTNNNRWITGMPVVYTVSSGSITGLTTSVTYYVIRSTATLIQLATTLANAQNGTAIDFTAQSSPIWTLTNTYTMRALGEVVGEESHAISSTEQLAHTHPEQGNQTGGVGVTNLQIITATNNTPQNSALATGSTGGNVAMNILQPTSYRSVMIKL